MTIKSSAKATYKKYLLISVYLLMVLVCVHDLLKFVVSLTFPRTYIPTIATPPLHIYNFYKKLLVASSGDSKPAWSYSKELWGTLLTFIKHNLTRIKHHNMSLYKKYLFLVGFKIIETTAKPLQTLYTEFQNMLVYEFILIVWVSKLCIYLFLFKILLMCYVLRYFYTPFTKSNF